MEELGGEPRNHRGAAVRLQAGSQPGSSKASISAGIAWRIS
jgi:hypothetical protein